MWPMFKKELRENWAYASAAFLGALLLLEIYCGDQGWDPLSILDAKTVPVWRSQLWTPLPIMMWDTCCVWLAALIAIKIVYEEQWRRTWPLLAQLPVSRERTVFAKFLAGLTIYGAITVVPAALLIASLARPGAWPAPFMFSDCWVLSFPWISGLCVYCLAFLSAQRQARWYVTKWLPLIPAVIIWVLSMRFSGIYIQVHSLRLLLRLVFEHELEDLTATVLRLAIAGLLLATVLAILGVRAQARTRKY
jgi:ABC-type transport system involved in multi-copper enzyme maturation permease subunit